MNTTSKSSLSHVINDNTVPITSDQHHHQQQQSTSSAFSLKNILSDDSPVHSQQHASSTQQSPPSQQYNHGAGNSGSGGNSNNNTVGYGGHYSNEQVHDYYHPRSHQPPTSQPQPSHNQLTQHTQQHQQEQFNEVEAGSILLSLSNQNTSNNQLTSNPNYIPPRESYHSKDIEHQMPDVVETSNIINSVKSNPQSINRQGSKNNSMSINSICCGGESGPSESGNSINSITNGSSMESLHQKYQQQSYPEDTHHHQQQIVDYNNLYNHSRKHAKKPSNGSIPLVVNTNQKIPQKEPKIIQKRASPQKRRPSEPSEYIKPKIHHRNSESNHFLHGPPTTIGGPKLTELREHLGEDRNANRITPIAPMAPIQVGMDWDRSHHSQQHNQHTNHTHSQPYHQTRQSHNVQPQAEINRYHPSTMPKSISPSLHGDPKFNYMNSNERQLNKTSPNGPPVHVPNGYSHGHGVGPVGGMIPDVLSQPSHQQPQPIPITQQQMPSLRGQHSAFSNQIHKKYNDMHDPKMKRNAPHAYISYMIYTNQMESGKSKDSHLQLQQNVNMPSRLTISNGSPTSNNDHMMPINYGHRDHREPQHPGYPPIQPAAPGYMHSSEAVTNSGRRVSDPSMHPGPRNVPHGYPPVNGTLDEHQPPSSHRQSISSHGSSPGLLPAHSSANSQQRNILPNLASSQRHVPNNLSPTTSTSRYNGISHQPPLPPIQSAPSSHLSHHHHHHPHPSNPQTHHHHHHSSLDHSSQTHTHGHHYHQPVSQASQPPPSVYMSGPPPLLAPQHSYSGKSSPAPPQPQSPINSSRQPNHYHHTSPTGPLTQSGSNRLPSSSHHLHHHSHHSTSEPVPPVNGNTQNILSPPLTKYLDSPSQSGGYGGSVHPHHHQHLTNGVGLNHPVNIAPAQAQALGPPVQRGTPNGYY